MSKIEKLKQELAGKKASSSNKTLFNGLIVTYLGKEPKDFYPKVKGADGKAVKGPDGKDLREATQTGVQWTFSELLTNRVVMLVLPLDKKINPEIMDVYKVAGLGYDMSSSNMLFIDEKGQAVAYA